MSDASEEAEEGQNVEEEDREEDGETQMLKNDDPSPNTIQEPCASVIVLRNVRRHTFACCMALITLLIAIPCRSLFVSYDVTSEAYNQFDYTSTHETNIMKTMNEIVVAQESSMYFVATGSETFKTAYSASTVTLKGLRPQVDKLGASATTLHLLDDLIDAFNDIANVRGKYAIDRTVGDGILLEAITVTVDSMRQAIGALQTLLTRYPKCSTFGISDNRCDSLNISKVLTTFETQVSELHITFYDKEFAASNNLATFTLRRAIMEASMRQLLDLTTSLVALGPSAVYGNPPIDPSMFTKLGFDVTGAQALAVTIQKLVIIFVEQTGSTAVQEWVASSRVLPFSNLMEKFSAAMRLSQDVSKGILVLLDVRRGKPMTQLRDDAKETITTAVAVCCTLMVIVFTYLILGVGVRQKTSLLRGSEFLTYSIIGLLILIGTAILVTFLARSLVDEPTEAYNMFAALDALANVTAAWYVDSINAVHGIALSTLPAAESLDITRATTQLTDFSIAPLQNIRGKAATNFSNVLLELINVQARFEAFRGNLVTLQTLYNATNATVLLKDRMNALVEGTAPPLMDAVSVACIRFESVAQNVQDSDQALKLCNLVFTMAHAALATVHGPDNRMLHWKALLDELKPKIVISLQTMLTLAATSPNILSLTGAVSAWISQYIAPLQVLLSQRTNSDSVGLQIAKNANFILATQAYKAKVSTYIPSVVAESKSHEKEVHSKKRRIIVWLTVFAVWTVQFEGYFLWRCVFPQE